VTQSIAVTDTHALILALREPRRLGKAAKRFMTRVAEGQAILFLPAIVLVEFAESHRAGDFRLDLPLEAWLRRLLLSGQFKIADLTFEVVMRSHELYAIRERADRLIAATALVLECPLITRDAEIMDSAEVECIW
jgi:PIN domain nuclease of toxin-antitoxin system